MNEIIDMLVDKGRSNYKCFNVLKDLLNNDDFFSIVKTGAIEGKITGFDDKIWDKIKSQNIRRINSFEDVFKEGANIGYCTVCSKQLSYSFDNCFICGGVLPILKGTLNCIDGSHTWLEVDNYIIDTSLMLVIKKDYAPKLGYILENKYDPNIDSMYRASKEFTNDCNLSK